jgi:hypothetical protein
MSPMARTVADPVAIFDVIAGYDPADLVTEASQGKPADGYLRFLDKDGARGVRLGVVRQLFTPENADADVRALMEQALADLARLGAVIVEPIRIAEIDTIPVPMLFCYRFKFDINDSLCTCCRHYPGAAAGVFLAHLPQLFQPSPEGSPGRPAHRPFRGLLSVHSRCGLHTRAVTNS